VERSAILLGKALGNLAFIAVVESLLLPLLSALFGVPLLRPAMLLVTALGTVGYAVVGTLLAAIAINTRAQEVMLPILLIPLAIPALIAAVRATGVLVDGGALADVGGWIRLLVVYDLVIVAVSMLTFGFVVEE